MCKFALHVMVATAALLVVLLSSLLLVRFCTVPGDLQLFAFLTSSSDRVAEDGIDSIQVDGYGQIMIMADYFYEARTASHLLNYFGEEERDDKPATTASDSVPSVKNDLSGQEQARQLTCLRKCNTTTWKPSKRGDVATEDNPCRRNCITLFDRKREPCLKKKCGGGSSRKNSCWETRCSRSHATSQKVARCFRTCNGSGFFVLPSPVLVVQ